MKITEQQVNLVVDLYNLGESGLKIASKLMLSTTQVYDLLKKKGVVARDSAARLKITPMTFEFRENLSGTDDQLLTAALMLYAGEGAKTGSTVDFANSDPGFLKIFLLFLRKICRVDENKLRFYLYCFDNNDVEQIKNFWVKTLNVSLNNFTKPYVRPFNGKNTRVMKYGVLHIRYNDKRLLEKILYLCSDLTVKLGADTQAANEVRLSKGSP